jgi:hypothetical protein
MLVNTRNVLDSRFDGGEDTSNCYLSYNPCSVVSAYHRFGRTYYLHLQVWKLQCVITKTITAGISQFRLVFLPKNGSPCFINA